MHGDVFDAQSRTNFIDSADQHMCDQDHFEEDLVKYSRRDLGSMAAVGVGAAFMLPSVADAADVAESDVTIETPDGKCDAYFVAPDSGSHAAV